GQPIFPGQPFLLYTEARLAALAAMASGPDAAEDAAALDPAERARLRGEAEEWLRALAGRSGDPQALAALRNIFRDAWRNPYLASLRDPPELEKLPVEEAARFRALWADLTRVAIDVLERLLDRGDRTVEPELRERRRSLLPDLPTFASIDDAIEHDPDERSFVTFRRAAGEAGTARLAYLDGRLLQLRGEHERALAELEKAMGVGAPEPVVRAVECLWALGREAEAEARLRLALGGGHERLERLWLESQGRQARSLEEILRGWPEDARPPIELPPVRDDASLRAVPLDLGPHFNRDVVADAGDDENDFVDSAARLVVFTVGEGGIVRGLPPAGVIGVHRLGDYAAKNALQLSGESRERVRLEVPRGRYREVRFLLTGGHGDSTVPLRLEYADGRRV
ncbi:MAG: hypothetical protein L0323_20040, partial [Planctomycetes bacterium]|nr:hypothetical protein [Planctomycetota bacterium]